MRSVIYELFQRCRPPSLKLSLFGAMSFPMTTSTYYTLYYYLPALGMATVTKEVDTITKEVAPITKEVDTITKEVATITKKVATITKLF